MSPPLRVVFDLRAAQSRHHPERGIARWVANLAAALDRRADIDLALLIDPERELYPSYAEMLTDARLVAAAELDEHRRGEVTVFHLSSPFEFDIPMRELLPPRLSVPTVIRATTLYDVIPLVYPDVHDEWLMRAWRWRAELVRSADLVLAISEHTAIDGVGRLGVRHSQIRTIGTGVPSFEPPNPRTPPRERPFVLYAGGTEHPRKNVGALIEAFGRLPDTLGDHDLVIAGRVAHDAETEIRRRAADAGMERRLELTGFVSDEELSALYSECRCFVYPSTYEGFGLPIAEAMARGAPVVASRTTSCGELLTRPEAGFDPTDVADIAAAMERVLRDRELAATLAREGLSAAAALTWDAVADRTVDAYRQKTAEQGPRRRYKARARRPTFWMRGSPGVGTPAAGMLQAALAAAARTPVGIATDVPLNPVENVRLVDPRRPEGRSGLQPGPVLCLVDSSDTAAGALALLTEREGLAVLWEVDRLIGDHLEEGTCAEGRRAIAELAQTGARLVVGSDEEAALLRGALPGVDAPDVIPPPIAWNVPTAPASQRLSLEAGLMLTARRRTMRAARSTRLMVAPRPPRYGPWPREQLLELARLARELRSADPRNRLMVLGDADPADVGDALEWCQLRHAGASLHVQPWPAFEEMAALLTAADVVADHGGAPASLGHAIERLARIGGRPFVSDRDGAVAWVDAMTRAAALEDIPRTPDRAPAAAADLLLAHLPRPILDRP